MGLAGVPRWAAILYYLMSLERHRILKLLENVYQMSECFRHRSIHISFHIHIHIHVHVHVHVHVHIHIHIHIYLFIYLFVSSWHICKVAGAVF